MVDAVVHPVASEDEVRFCFSEGAVKALLQVGSGKGMFWFGESAEGFGGKAGRNDFGSMTFEVQGGLQIVDEMSAGGDGIAKKENAVGGEEDVLGFGDSPNIFEDGDDFWVVFNEGGTVVGCDVVFAEVGFGGFREIFHLVVHGVGRTMVGFKRLPGNAGATGDVDVGSRFLGATVGEENLLMVVAENVVVVGVGELVESEVGHAHRVLLKLRDVGILDGLGKLNREAVGLEPARAWVMTGTALSVFGG